MPHEPILAIVLVDCCFVAATMSAAAPPPGCLLATVGDEACPALQEKWIRQRAPGIAGFDALTRRGAPSPSSCGTRTEVGLSPWAK
jgi:hypothetical protein